MIPLIFFDLWMHSNRLVKKPRKNKLIISMFSINFEIIFNATTYFLNVFGDVWSIFQMNDTFFPMFWLKI